MYGIGEATVKCKLIRATFNILNEEMCKILDVLIRHFIEENFRSTGKESETVILLQQN